MLVLPVRRFGPPHEAPALTTGAAFGNHPGRNVPSPRYFIRRALRVARSISGKRTSARAL